ncbi:MAG: hypothetical protein LBD40_01660, partial [Puniceicoccales bacterium]|nr:hypothetical protein [Puniceicoccales bacterium]
MMDRSSFSPVRGSTVESLAAVPLSKQSSSLAAHHSAEILSPGSGKVTTLHHLRQSESDEAFTSVAHKVLQEHKAASLPAEDLLQTLERVFN